MMNFIVSVREDNHLLHSCLSQELCVFCLFCPCPSSFSIGRPASQLWGVNSYPGHNLAHFPSRSLPISSRQSLAALLLHSM